MRGIDATLQELPGGAFDCKIGFDGDIETEDAFDSAIIVSLFCDRRANEAEVLDSGRRRGWVGNEFTPGFEMGSKIWLFEQARLTRTVMNQIEDAARAALQWLVDQGFAVAVNSVRVRTSGQGSLFIDLEIQRTSSVVERRYFELWNNTGIAG